MNGNPPKKLLKQITPSEIIMGQTTTMGVPRSLQHCGTAAFGPPRTMNFVSVRVGRHVEGRPGAIKSRQ